MYQNVTIAGQIIDKKDAVNGLSFLVLKSVAQTRLTQPNLTVRYHKNINKHFFGCMCRGNAFRLWNASIKQ